MKKILIIDDHDGFRGLLEKTISMSGYQVISAANGESGLQLFYDRQPDVVITDIFMPVKDGLEVIAEITRAGHGSKVIAVSGGAKAYADDCLKMAKKMSAGITFCKPFDMDELLAAIAAILDQGVEQRDLSAVN